MTTQHFATSTPQLPAVASHDDNQDVLLKVSEVARRLRVDDTTVRRWVKNGVLRAVMLPSYGQRKTIRVHSQTIDELINSGRTEVQ